MWRSEGQEAALIAGASDVEIPPDAKASETKLPQAGGVHHGTLRAVLLGSVGFLVLLAALASRANTTLEVTSMQDAISLAAEDSAPEVEVYPVRLLLFRHGFSCSNALSAAGCADPDAPILHLSEADQTALFDNLDSIGTTFAAPKTIPPIDRSFGIEGRGKKYSGGDPLRPKGYRGDDCMLHLQPRRNNDTQWHEAGDVIQLRHFYRDPVLNACSKFQNEKAGESFRGWLKQEGIKLDFLGASLLIRTFQTAHGHLLSDPKAWKDVFSKEMLEGEHAPNVSQVPFVNEFDAVWGYQADDYAWPQEEQRKFLLSAMGEEAVEHLDYSHLAGFTDEERRAQDWDAFKEKVLGQRLVPFVLQRRGQSMPKKVAKASLGEPFQKAHWGSAAKLAAGSSGKLHPMLNIAMASHYGFIDAVCGYGVNNYAVQEMVLLVEIRKGGEVVVRQQRGQCKEVMAGLAKTKSLPTRDVENCRHPFDMTQAFVDQEGSAEELTQCEKLALGADAFRTSPAAKLHVKD